MSAGCHRYRQVTHIHRCTHIREQTALYSSHTPSRVDSQRAEQAHNVLEELHTYSKVIYFISPIKGSDKIVALHCKSISLSHSSQEDLQMAKLISQGSHALPLSMELKKGGLVTHKLVCLWKPPFPYHYQYGLSGCWVSASLSCPWFRGCRENLGANIIWGLFLWWSWPSLIDTDTLAIWLALPAAWGALDHNSLIACFMYIPPPIGEVLE